MLMEHHIVPTATQQQYSSSMQQPEQINDARQHQKSMAPEYSISQKCSSFSGQSEDQTPKWQQELDDHHSSGGGGIGGSGFLIRDQLGFQTTHTMFPSQGQQQIQGFSSQRHQHQDQNIWNAAEWRTQEPFTGCNPPSTGQPQMQQMHSQQQQYQGFDSKCLLMQTNNESGETDSPSMYGKNNQSTGSLQAKDFYGDQPPNSIMLAAAVVESPYDESVFSSGTKQPQLQSHTDAHQPSKTSLFQKQASENSSLGITMNVALKLTSQDQEGSTFGGFTHQEGAFKRFARRNANQEQETAAAKGIKLIGYDGGGDVALNEDETSVFSISENIKMMLLDDNASTTAKGSNNTQDQQTKATPQGKRSDSNILLRMTLKIVDTLRICNARFNYQPVIMNPKRDLTQPSEGVYNNGFDNIDNDYILRASDFIISPEGKEYEILDLLGKGTFGQAVKCECQQTKEMVAIKVIKNKKAFKNQGVVEIKILDILNRLYDPSGDTPIVRMLDFFVFRDHLCIVFELLSVSIYDLLKENMFQGLSLNISRLIISQILDAMKVVKDAKLIHCDLKPENILLKSKENPNIKVIDFGSACFEGFAIFQYIQSRYYRSPEVLLGLPYDSAIDMWSLGCISAELFLGIPIFPGNSEYDQLARIIEILGPIPQYLIQRAKFRDKFFIYQPQTDTFRFKTIEEYQYTMGVRLEYPRKYFEGFTSLDYMKTMFFAKKRQEQTSQSSQNNSAQKRVQSLVVLESEINAMDAFIDFLKGILRIDKDLRWNPSMAMEHPFITREQFTGHFEPKRELEKSSTHDTGGEDTMSEKSNSSKDSKEYKAGSCPSRILYPQTATAPQYLQQHPVPNPQIQPQLVFGNKGSHQQPQMQNQQQQTLNSAVQYPTSSQAPTHDFVFYGNQGSHLNQAHRPPILSIPDEYFKGFMFGRLDQILSMTREQLVQFIYEQQEMQFRQHAQKYMMQQQQYQQFQLQQQQLQQQRLQQMMMMIQEQQLGSGQNQQYMLQNQPQYQAKGQNAFLQGQLNNIPLSQQQFGQMSGMVGGRMGNFVMPSQQIPAQFQGFPVQSQINGPSGMNQMNQGYPPVQMMMPPNEQIVFNPPPYMQQKQQLHVSTAYMNDPQYQAMMIQQQQRKNQQRMQGMNAGQNAENRGKAGSWHAPNALQAQKYNHYYNQINNPGQLIGRQVYNQAGGVHLQPQMDFNQYFQQQFYPVPLGLQPNIPFSARQGQNQQLQYMQNAQFPQQQLKEAGGMPIPGVGMGLQDQALSLVGEPSGKKSALNSDKKRGRFGESKLNSGLGSTESLSQTVIEEEKEKNTSSSQEQRNESGNPNKSQVPFPENKFLNIGGYAIDHQQFKGLATLPKKPSTENLYITPHMNESWLQQYRQHNQMMHLQPANFEQTPPQMSRQLFANPHPGANISMQYGKAGNNIGQGNIDQHYAVMMQQNASLQHQGIAGRQQYPPPNYPPQQAFQQQQFLGQMQKQGSFNNNSPRFIPPGKQASQQQQQPRLFNSSSRGSFGASGQMANQIPHQSIGMDSAVNTSFSSIHSNSSGHREQIPAGGSNNKGFLNKLQSNQQQQMMHCTQSLGQGQASLSNSSSEKQLFNKSMQRSYQKQESIQNSNQTQVIEHVQSTASFDHNTRNRSDSDQMDDQFVEQQRTQQQSMYSVNMSGVGPQYIRQGQLPRQFMELGMQGSQFKQPVGIQHHTLQQQHIPSHSMKLDQPLQRIVKGQQTGGLSFEQILQQKKEAEAKMDQGHNQQFMSSHPLLGSHNYGSSGDQEMKQDSSRNMMGPQIQQDQSSFSIFENQPGPYSSQPLQPSPRKAHFSATKKGQKKLSQRQTSNHNSIAKNLTPIDESKYIEDEHGTVLQSQHQYHFGLVDYPQQQIQASQQHFQQQYKIVGAGRLNLQQTEDTEQQQQLDDSMHHRSFEEQEQRYSQDHEVEENIDNEDQQQHRNHQFNEASSSSGSEESFSNDKYAAFNRKNSIDDYDDEG